MIISMEKNICMKYNGNTNKREMNSDELQILRKW